MGNQTSVRLSDSTTNTFAYDEWSRLKTANFAATSSASARTVTYSYTPTGQRYQVTDSSRGATPVTYSYDNLDRTTLITQPNGNAVGYSYDVRNNRTAITTTVGSVISATTYSYSNANQLLTVTAPTDPGSVHTSYTYDPAGRRTQLNLPNSDMVQYGYDQLNRLLTINQSKNGVTPLASYTYTLDKAGNRTGVSEGSGRTIAWSYDNAYRLTSEADSAAAGITTTYSYDGVGNRLSMTSSGVITNYQYNELDQLTTVLSGTTPTLSYSYVRGNLTQVKNSATNAVQQSYSWDSADRLVGATVSAGSTSYAYDADGRRIKQTAGSTITNYLWDETSAYGDVLVETDNGNVIKTSYILGNGELISQKRTSVTSPDYYLKDGQGSVRNLTDNTGGLESGQNFTYDAFGNLTSGQTSPASNYLYTGQQFDILTKLYDLRARYYDPTNDRFITSDTLGVTLDNLYDLNKYIYSSADPINRIDPSGHDSLDENSFLQVSFRNYHYILQRVPETVAFRLIDGLANALRAKAIHREVREALEDINVRQGMTKAAAQSSVGNLMKRTTIAVSHVAGLTEYVGVNSNAPKEVIALLEAMFGERLAVGYYNAKEHAEVALFHKLLNISEGSIDKLVTLIGGTIGVSSAPCGPLSKDCWGYFTALSSIVVFYLEGPVYGPGLLIN